MNRGDANSIRLFGFDSAAWGIGTTVPVNSPATGNPDPAPPENPGNPGDNDPGIIRPSNLVSFSAVTAGISGDQWHVDKGLCEASRAADMGFQNDDLSSVYINEDNVVLELFENENFQGKSVRFDRKGFYDLRDYDFDDITSSYRISDPTAPESPTQPSAQAPYSVASVSVDSNGDLAMKIVNESTGEETQPVSWRKGAETGTFNFIVRVQDNVSFYLDPAWGVLSMDTDASFASVTSGPAAAQISGDGRGIRAFPGATVHIGTQPAGGDSFTLRIRQGEADSQTGASGDGGGSGSAPGGGAGTQGGQGAQRDPDIITQHDVNLNGGGGCSATNPKGLMGIALASVAAAARSGRRKR